MAIYAVSWKMVEWRNTMKKNAKRLFAVILSLVMVCGSMLTVNAASTTRFGEYGGGSYWPTWQFRPIETMYRLRFHVLQKVLAMSIVCGCLETRGMPKLGYMMFFRHLVFIITATRKNQENMFTHHVRIILRDLR